MCASSVSPGQAEREIVSQFSQDLAKYSDMLTDLNQFDSKYQ